MPLNLKMIWKTRNDQQVCPICKALEGYTWILKCGVDTYPIKLVHPVFGPVYDTRQAAGRSLVKEEKGHICRCTLKHEFDLSSVLTKVEQTHGNEFRIADEKEEGKELNRPKITQP